MTSSFLTYPSPAAVERLHDRSPANWTVLCRSPVALSQAAALNAQSVGTPDLQPRPHHFGVEVAFPDLVELVPRTTNTISKTMTMISMTMTMASVSSGRLELEGTPSVRGVTPAMTITLVRAMTPPSINGARVGWHRCPWRPHDLGVGRCPRCSCDQRWRYQIF